MLNINRLLIILGVCLLCTSPLQGQPLGIKLHQVMSEREIKNMGLDLQSPQQRRQLERWLTQYTRRVERDAGRQQEPPGYFLRGTNLDVAPPTGTERDDIEFFQERRMPRQRILSPYDRPEQEIEDRYARDREPKRPILQKQDYNPYAKVLIVEAIEDDGLTLKLTDGSVWAISLLHRDRVSYWRPEHRLNAYRSGNPEFPYRLVNLSLNDWAEAELSYAPDPRATDEEQSGPPEKTVRAIQEVMGGGSKLKLEDGSVWEVAPWHKYRSKGWLPEEGVKILRNESPVYPFRLINVDSQETIEARQSD